MRPNTEGSWEPCTRPRPIKEPGRGSSSTKRPTLRLMQPPPDIQDYHNLRIDLLVLIGEQVMASADGNFA